MVTAVNGFEPHRTQKRREVGGAPDLSNEGGVTIRVKDATIGVCILLFP